MGNVQMANAATSEFGSQVCPQILVSIFFSFRVALSK